mmetsp:Transcript_19400/g.62241  ORF Transcript_19400/g.62241 Transcript_19400/m.62241 type:complete len:1616 (-) Transcript_19400:180-5027(-)
MGFAALRALARVLDRRTKHAYAVLALEVCVAILELRDDHSERRRLQRELAVVSARQGERDCPRYCLRVLKDLDDRLEARTVRLRDKEFDTFTALRTSCSPKSDGEGGKSCYGTPIESSVHLSKAAQAILKHAPCAEADVSPSGGHKSNGTQDRRHPPGAGSDIDVVRTWYGASDSPRTTGGDKPVDVAWMQCHCETAALADLQDILLATELAASRALKSTRISEAVKAQSMLVDLARRIETRLGLVRTSSAAASELEGLLDRVQLGLARLALDHTRPAEAASILDACLASARRSSTARRVALLSWTVRARLDLQDVDGARCALARICYLRRSAARKPSQCVALGVPADSVAGVISTTTSRRQKRCVASGSVQVVSHTPRLCHVVGSSSERYTAASFVAGEECSSNILNKVASCLLSHSGPAHDLGELSAKCDLARGDALAALRRLAPTIAAVEMVVCRCNTQAGLCELGRLYHLRGEAQEALSRAALCGDFPLRFQRAVVAQPACQERSDKTSPEQSRDYATQRTAATESTVRHSATARMGRRLFTETINKRFFKRENKQRRFFASHTLSRPSTDASLPVQMAGNDAYGLTTPPVSMFSPHGVALASGQCTHSLPRQKQLEKTSGAACALTGATMCSATTASVGTMHSILTVCPGKQGEPRRRRSLSRSSEHYQSYTDVNELVSDALRWYRHALECFKARDDDLGVARSASAFVRLQLERVIGPVAFERVPLPAAADAFLCGDMDRSRSLATATGDANGVAVAKVKLTVDDIDAAARCALSIAAVACEPLLLLETYLNVAEMRLVRRDRLGAIAHWWEARELFLRLFVVGDRVPLVSHCGDPTTIEALRIFLERLVRFLGACDRSMINENMLLFDIFITFEKDARTAWQAVARQHFFPAGDPKLFPQAEATVKTARPPGFIGGVGLVAILDQASLLSFTDGHGHVPASCSSPHSCPGTSRGVCSCHHLPAHSQTDTSLYQLNAASARDREIRRRHLSSSAVDYAHRAMQPCFSALAHEPGRCEDREDRVFEDRLFRLRLGLPVAVVHADHRSHAWECLTRVRNDVTRHRRNPAAQLEDLRDRNRSTLRALCSWMCGMRTRLAAAPPSAYTFEAIRHEAGVVRNRVEAVVYALHVASMLLIYCPRTGARRTIALGRGATRFTGLHVKRNDSTFDTTAERHGQKRSKLRADESSSSAAMSTAAGNSGSTGSINNYLSLKATILVAALAGERRLLQGSPSCRSAVAKQQMSSDITSRKLMLVALADDLTLLAGIFEELLGSDDIPPQQRPISMPSSLSATETSPAVAPNTIVASLPDANLAACADVESALVHAPNLLSVRLVCSERAQLLPWECLAGDDVRCSRSPCAYGRSCAYDEGTQVNLEDVSLPPRRTGNAQVGHFDADTADTPPVRFATAGEEPSKVTLELLSHLCRRDVVHAAAVYLGHIACQRQVHRPGSSELLTSTSEVPLALLGERRWSFARRAIFSWLRRRHKPKLKLTTCGARNSLNSSVVILELGSLFRGDDSAQFLVDAGDRPVFFAPSSCFDAVCANAEDHFREMPSSLLAPPRDAMCGRAVLESNADAPFINFAHAMTRKYAAPIIYFERPPVVRASLYGAG